MSTSGRLTAEQIREKFGFAYNEAHAGGSAQSKYGGSNSGAIYSTDTGEYIGTVPGFSPSKQSDGKDEAAKGINPFKAVENYGIQQGLRGKARTNWNTMNDVAGAVNDIYGEGAAPEPEPEPAVDRPASEKLTKAQAFSQAYRDHRMDGGAVDVMAGNLGARDEFLNNYKLNVKRRMEPGVAQSVGNDDLPPMDKSLTDPKVRADRPSKIAADIIGKGAGYGLV